MIAMFSLPCLVIGAVNRKPELKDLFSVIRPIFNNCLCVYNGRYLGDSWLDVLRVWVGWIMLVGCRRWICFHWGALPDGSSVSVWEEIWPHLWSNRVHAVKYTLLLFWIAKGGIPGGNPWREELNRSQFKYVYTVIYMVSKIICTDKDVVCMIFLGPMVRTPGKKNHVEVKFKYISIILICAYGFQNSLRWLRRDT